MINVDLAHGLSGFNIDVNGKRYDNAGRSFHVQDSVVFQQANSCYNAATMMLTIYGAIKNNIHRPRVTLEVYDKCPHIGSIVPGLVQDSVRMEHVRDSSMSIHGYRLYRGTYTYTTSDGGEFSVVAHSWGRPLLTSTRRRCSIMVLHVL
ncbi:hypothetical protein AX17_005356, partial [Amanita inopinata Kibby_2008]